METIAVFNKEDRLVGYTEVEEVLETDIVFPDGGDLPIDGTYKREGKTLVPLGHGFPKPPKPPVATDYAMYLMMKALVYKEPLPGECSDWVRWYDKNLKKRNEELELAKKKRIGG